MSSPAFQQTIAKPVRVRGFGYWSGQDVCLEFCPAAADTGVVFVRTDLSPAVLIPARSEFRVEAVRRTVLQNLNARVEMVEHVLSALAGLGIDNCVVRTDAAEMPGCDGSAAPFVEALDTAGIVELGTPRDILRIDKRVRRGNAQAWIEASPPDTTGLSIEVHLDFPHAPAIGRQSVLLTIDPETFRRELACCRTFLLQQEAEIMQAEGLGQRVSSRDLLIFDEHGPIENPLLFPDECVRHKALDLIGDLALVGRPIQGRVVAYKSGHQLNGALAAALVSQSAAIERASQRISA